ncbi:metal ABC transporter ATP-binding protein [Ruminococcus difficilis]|uniref:ABC transporter ATP-binding protein n=1 Tax=Ruminococcus difficilis TaxID=2763069 RepID=A0A934TZW6_9FIRM|nr:ABC transporter ATP-binding protein [Ruminococcus difficilis]MBK6087880.1 ABC transporter ATP-binding protein [Ruminococcus difficilis]
MAQLICRDLCPGYNGQEIIGNLNFEVEKGDYLCIVGENGSGKSTLMKTLLGLQPPVSGQVLLDEGLTRNRIGYLPQQTEIQKDFPASVREIVLSGCQNKCGARPFYSKADKERAQANIEKMGLQSLKKRCYRHLSGGQQQRVLLARALCAAEELLLLDEPVAGLDPIVTEEMYRLIDGLHRDDGMTIIMISHDLDAAIQYADKILHIGKKVFFGTKAEYLESSQSSAFVKGEVYHG